MRRAFVIGLFGYFAPVALMLTLCMFRFGWDVMVDNVRKFVLIHWPLTLHGILFLTPQLMCAGFLAWGSLRSTRSSFSKPQSRLLDPWKIGLAILSGYTLLIVVSAIRDPIPWTWSAEKTAVVRLAVVILFPLNMIAYGYLRNFFVRDPTEIRDDS